MGSNWVYLRLCLTRGHVGCMIHFLTSMQQNISKTTEHDTIRSFKPGRLGMVLYRQTIINQKIKVVIAIALFFFFPFEQIKTPLASTYLVKFRTFIP